MKRKGTGTKRKYEIAKYTVQQRNEMHKKYSKGQKIEIVETEKTFEGPSSKRRITLTVIKPYLYFLHCMTEKGTFRTLDYIFLEEGKYK